MNKTTSLKQLLLVVGILIQVGCADTTSTTQDVDNLEPIELTTENFYDLVGAELVW